MFHLSCSPLFRQLAHKHHFIHGEHGVAEQKNADKPGVFGVRYVFVGQQERQRQHHFPKNRHRDEAGKGVFIGAARGVDACKVEANTNGHKQQQAGDGKLSVGPGRFHRIMQAGQKQPNEGAQARQLPKERFATHVAGKDTKMCGHISNDE